MTWGMEVFENIDPGLKIYMEVVVSKKQYKDEPMTSVVSRRNS